MSIVLEPSIPFQILVSLVDAEEMIKFLHMVVPSK